MARKGEIPRDLELYVSTSIVVSPSLLAAGRGYCCLGDGRHGGIRRSGSLTPGCLPRACNEPSSWLWVSRKLTQTSRRLVRYRRVFGLGLNLNLSLSLLILLRRSRSGYFRCNSSLAPGEISRRWIIPRNIPDHESRW
jgi:hypothetical protein